MELGVHDILPLNEHQTTQEKYQETIELAKAVESFNYHRYWASEHHGIDSAASSAPEILIAYLAAVTDKIRLGTGGTMIMHYSPLKVAEVFKTLSLLAPDRIDFGIGRAPGGGQNEIIALASGKQPDFDDLIGKAQIILDYYLDKPTPGIYGQTKAIPAQTGNLIQPWMLGSSGQSAMHSGEMGLGYSFAKFFGIETEPEVFQAYRDSFKPSEFFDKPKVMASYIIILADSQEEADYIAKPAEISNLYSNAMRLMDPEKAQKLEIPAEAKDIIQSKYDKRFLIKGTPAQVESILAEEIEHYGLDEIMAYMPIYHLEDKIKSYKLLAQIFDKV